MTTAESALSRPLPLPTPVSRPYWDGLARGEVWIQYSPSSDRYIFYPRVLAPGTLADDLVWRRISGHGTLVSFTVARRPVAAHFTAPQILAVVAWDEGPRFATEIVGTSVDELRIGMPVQPAFTAHPDGGVTLLQYTAAR